MGAGGGGSAESVIGCLLPTPAASPSSVRRYRDRGGVISPLQSYGI